MDKSKRLTHHSTIELVSINQTRDIFTKTNPLITVHKEIDDLYTIKQVKKYSTNKKLSESSEHYDDWKKISESSEHYDDWKDMCMFLLTTPFLIAACLMVFFFLFFASLFILCVPFWIIDFLHEIICKIFGK